MIKVVFIDSKGRAVTHVARVKRAVDEVMWIDQSNAGPWWITLDKPNSPSFPDPDYVPGSPFSGETFQVPRNGNVKSGVTNGGVALGTYKYNVRKDSANGQVTNDPDIDIE